MVFSSFTFLCCFLPIVLLGYFCCPNLKIKNLFLLIASCIFYGWSDIDYLKLMFFVIFITYIGALIVDGVIPKRKKICFLLAFVSFVFTGLFYFKYFNFTIKIVNDIYHKNIETWYLILPIGISFYTFQAVSYLVDVYRGIKPQKNFFNLALYISMFPQLVAGPIVKYQTIEKQLTQRKHLLDNVYAGVQRFIIGLSKKILIADTLAMSVDKIFATPIHELSLSIVWMGIIFYALQIYFDFSGYSDMAIGLGRVFGFRFLENFNYPYVSKSIAEFWRRWHISLSSWFKEYVYIPLGGSKEGLSKTLRNLFVVFFLTGLWHGAEYTFVVWGLWHGFFIMAERLFSKLKVVITPPRQILYNTLKIIAYFYTLIVVLIGWVFFRAPDLAYAMTYIKAMFMAVPFNPDFSLGYYISKGGWMIFVIGVFLSLGWGQKLGLFFDKNAFTKIGRDIFCLCLLVLSVVFLTATSYSPFIYFRF